ncbi:MAG: CheR family methyltransferase [Chloroflexota bacterium]
MFDPVQPELEAFKNFLQEHTGFNFPAGLDKEFGFRLERALRNRGYNLSQLLHQLYKQETSQAIVQTLSPLLPELLIGETYFWREPDIFEALTNQVLPEIMRRKESFSRLFRVWSAACSTGEEAYSLSILLHHYFKTTDWALSVMGSDLNEKSLETARKGEYGEYSFRSADNKKYATCFEPTTTPKRWRVKDLYRQGVRFQKINLASNDYPSTGNDSCNYDLIFCRNVFIYFKPDLTEQVVDRLFESLNEGGYLVVSPSEYSQQHFKRFEAVSVGTLTLYRRPLRSWAWMEPPKAEEIPPLFNSSLLPSSFATSRVVETKEWVMPPIVALPPVQTPGAPELVKQARAILAKGQTDECIALCLKAIKKDSLFAESYLLLAGLYQEAGQLDQALEMARKFNYLEPNRPEGQFYLATLQQIFGRNRRAAQAYRRLIAILNSQGSETSLACLPGLSTVELRQLAVESLLVLESELGN